MQTPTAAAGCSSYPSPNTPSKIMEWKSCQPSLASAFNLLEQHQTFEALWWEWADLPFWKDEHGRKAMQRPELLEGQSSSSLTTSLVVNFVLEWSRRWQRQQQNEKTIEWRKQQWGFVAHCCLQCRFLLFLQTHSFEGDRVWQKPHESGVPEHNLGILRKSQWKLSWKKRVQMHCVLSNVLKPARSSEKIRGKRDPAQKSTLFSVYFR